LSTCDRSSPNARGIGKPRVKNALRLPKNGSWISGTEYTDVGECASLEGVLHAWIIIKQQGDGAARICARLKTNGHHGLMDSNPMHAR